MLYFKHTYHNKHYHPYDLQVKTYEDVLYLLSNCIPWGEGVRFLIREETAICKSMGFALATILFDIVACNQWQFVPSLQFSICIKLFGTRKAKCERGAK